MRTRALVLSMVMLALPWQGWSQTLRPGEFLSQPTVQPTVVSRPAPKNGEGEPVVLAAEEVTYDQKEEVVVARGKVEIVQGDNVVMADQVTYYMKRDEVVAEGNVSMLQPSGDVYFSNRAQLNNALKTGVIDNFKARLADNTVFVADRAVKESAAVTKLSNASYTPCTICETAAPFWQLNADDATVDEKEERITYHGATLEFGGFPVLYTPYLSHSTPDAGARSGILMPQYIGSSNIGSVIRVPYYWRIHHDKEAVITPWISSEEGFLLQGGYRQLKDNGAYKFDATATLPEKRDTLGNQIGGSEFRGHLFAQGAEELNDISRVGFDIARASDDTFLRRYRLGDQPTLFSRFFYEAAEGRNYALAQGLAIQGMRATDDKHTTPFVLPALQAYYESAPDAHNIRYHAAGDVQALARDQGIDQRRISMTAGASLPYVTSGGHVFTGTLNVRQDLYQTDNVPINGSAQTRDHTNYRILPQMALEWRYPLIQQFGKGSWMVEPLALGILQSSKGNPVTISNEDSHLLELTDTNLFSLNRMPGLDVVDSGPRVAYGARSQFLFGDGTALEGLVGQSYNPDSSTPFPNSTTPDEDLSDLIGRVAYNVAPLTFSYRFALDKDTYKAHRNEFGFQFGKPWLTFGASYRSIDNNQFLVSSEEGQAAMSLPLTDRWSIHTEARRNFTIDEFVSAGGGILYKNECFNLLLDTQRNFSRDRDIEPTTTYMLQIALKNLGEFGYGGTFSGASQ